MSCYWYPTSWAHHAHLEATSLAASATAHWIQARQFWCTKQWMVCLHNIWWTNASLPLLPANDDYYRQMSPRVRFQELAQVSAIAHSLLLDHICGTTYLSIYATEHTFLEFCRLLKMHLFCWGQWRLVTVCYCAPYTSALTLHCITMVHSVLVLIHTVPTLMTFLYIWHFSDHNNDSALSTVLLISSF